jgi:hypothetical protein
MPRIRDGYNNSYDFCLVCFPCEEEAKYVFGKGYMNRSYFEYDIQHPDYNDQEYTCFCCNRKLSNADNKGQSI